MNKFINMLIATVLLMATSGIAHASPEKGMTKPLSFYRLHRTAHTLVEVRYQPQVGTSPEAAKSALAWAYVKAVNNLPMQGWGCDAGKRAVQRDSRALLAAIVDKKAPITEVEVILHCN